MTDSTEDFEKQINRIISKAYHCPTGLSTPYKVYQDVHPKDKRITLQLVKDWFAKNVEKQNK